jgi:uncharacterized protein (TIGR00730 family)
MPPERAIKNVCVFCGSRPGDDPAFASAAAVLGRSLATRGMTLVYGGARVGVMGILADAALGAGGRVIGVIPKGLVSKEIAHDGLSEMFLTDTMHERKDRMLGLADAFVTMPGGFGTYDELFEVVTLAQVGFHDKPIGLLDTSGFFAPLVALLRHTIAHAFAAPEHEALIVREEDPERLLDAIVRYTSPPRGEKWTDRR